MTMADDQDLDETSAELQKLQKQWSDEAIDSVAGLLAKNMEPETATAMLAELEQKTDGMDSDNPDVVLTNKFTSAVREALGNPDECGE